MAKHGWQQAWDDLSKVLTNHVERNRNPAAEKYLSDAFGYVACSMENIDGRLTKHQEIVHLLYPLLVELQDILRSTLICQQNLITASSAFNLRSAFEISCNLRFIYMNEDPPTAARKLEHFFRYEQLVGARLSHHLPTEPEHIERQFADLHPYWKNKETGLLGENKEWHGTKLKFKDVAILVGKEKDYFSLYKMSSKFVHGSPLIRNIYGTQVGLSCVPAPGHLTHLNLNCANVILYAYADFCKFFGVSIDNIEFNSVVAEIVTAIKSLGLPKKN